MWYNLCWKTIQNKQNKEKRRNNRTRERVDDKTQQEKEKKRKKLCNKIKDPNSEYPMIKIIMLRKRKRKLTITDSLLFLS